MLDSNSLIFFLTGFVFQGDADFLNAPDNAGMTPVMWAAYNNNYKHVQKLVAAGADLEEKDVDAKTAMHWVCDF